AGPDQGGGQRRAEAQERRLRRRGVRPRGRRAGCDRAPASHQGKEIREQEAREEAGRSDRRGEDRVKRWFLTNFTTMVMALFLSILTWFYLFTQGNGPAVISVQFLPKLDMKDFASVTFQSTDGQEVSPEKSLSISVVGPK